MPESLGGIDDVAPIGGPMRIRPLTPDDEPFLLDALYYAIYIPLGEDAPAYEIVKQPELVRYVAGWMTHSDDLGFAAEENAGPIGAAWLRRWSSGERGFGFVDEETPELSTALFPEYRGRGVGTRLLRQLLCAAAERYDAVSLSVSVSNPARRLYEREGFMTVSEPGGGSITMMKKFSPRNGA
jgi:GNAT superfamily N-acetyltransferase